MNFVKAPETMTSRERVRAVFAGKLPDRLPISYMANRAIDARLKAHFGLAANDNLGLRRALGADHMEIRAPYVGPRLHAEVEGRWVDPQWGIHTRWIEHASGGYQDYCDFPLAEATLEEIEAWPMPNPDDFDYEACIKLCHEHPDWSMHVGNPGLGDIINTTGMIRSMEVTLMDIASAEEACMRLIDRRLAIQAEVTRRTLEACKGYIDYVWMGEDLGTQHAPMISKTLYRRELRPRHQAIVDIATAYDLPVMVHTCGSSSWVYEDFIEMGIRSVDTLQPEAANMEPAYLKKTFGERLVLHGCISTAGPVAYGTVEDVEKDIKEKLSVLMPGGNYMFAPTHALQDNSPTQNVLRMYQLAHDLGRY